MIVFLGSFLTAWCDVLQLDSTNFDQVECNKLVLTTLTALFLFCST